MNKIKVAYVYNEENFEFQYSAILDDKLNCENYTTVEPPEAKKNEVALYIKEKDAWKIEKDYRFTHKMSDSELNIKDIEDIGKIPNDMILVDNETAEKILENKNLYIIDGDTIREKDYDEIMEDRHNKLKSYSMTKRDFFNYVCKPNGISYENLVSIIKSNQDILENWELCSRVFRGDETLCKNIEKYIPDMTEEVLDGIFEKYGSPLNE